MSVSLVSTIEEAHAKSWREWQVQNEDGERQRARRARVVFTLIFIALGVWFGLQLVPVGLFGAPAFETVRSGPEESHAEASDQRSPAAQTAAAQIRRIVGRH